MEEWSGCSDELIGQQGLRTTATDAVMMVTGTTGNLCCSQQEVHHGCKLHPSRGEVVFSPQKYFFLSRSVPISGIQVQWNVLILQSPCRVRLWDKLLTQRLKKHPANWFGWYLKNWLKGTDHWLKTFPMYFNRTHSLRWIWTKLMIMIDRSLHSKCFLTIHLVFRHQVLFYWGNTS